jgi:RNA-directed DNA polymerase
MMHGHEESDPEIVAIRTNAGGIRREKPANKAAPAAAALVERRAGTKRNAGQQSTLRAQDRAGVSQALDRIRQAARHNKKERFTALLHHINPDTLRLAFNALKKDAAPGVDGVTWSDYEVDLERKLEALHDRVHRGAYRPQPSRRVYIPKADGRQPLVLPFHPALAGWNLWQASPARGRRSRGQDCPRCGHDGAERDLRGRFPRVLVWVPTGTRPA